MGMLRTLLAIAVLSSHTPWPGHGSYTLMGGRNAVQLFYMISGFLIAYILNNVPSYRNSVIFYLNRALRIYPIYYVVAAIAVTASLITHSGPLPTIASMPVSAQIIVVAANTMLFGQDWLMFLAIQHGHLVATANFQHTDIFVFEGQLVRQAWTLGLEMTFYLIAPFVVRSTPRTIALLALSVLARAVFYLRWPELAASDPWTYRFFPFELSLFLLGALSQQVMLPRWQALGRHKAYANYVTAGFLVAGGLVFLVPASEFLKSLVLFGAFFFCLPSIFIFQNDHAWDSEIGELSYPLYLGHWLVLGVVIRGLAKLGITAPVLVTAACIAGSLAFAVALNLAVARPVEKLRARVKKQRTAAAVTN